MFHPEVKGWAALAVPVLDAAAVVSIRCMLVPPLPRGRVSERAMGQGL
jgi:hypothetical protein